MNGFVVVPDSLPLPPQFPEWDLEGKVCTRVDPPEGGEDDPSVDINHTY